MSCPDRIQCPTESSPPPGAPCRHKQILLSTRYKSMIRRHLVCLCISTRFAFAWFPPRLVLLRFPTRPSNSGQQNLGHPPDQKPPDCSAGQQDASVGIIHQSEAGVKRVGAASDHRHSALKASQTAYAFCQRSLKFVGQPIFFSNSSTDSFDACANPRAAAASAKLRGGPSTMYPT